MAEPAQMDAMSSAIVTVDGTLKDSGVVEQMTINKKQPRGKQILLGLALTLIGLLGIFFTMGDMCWWLWSWTVFPFILSGSVSILTDKCANHYLLRAACVIILVSFITTLAGLIAFKVGWDLEVIISCSNFVGLFIAVYSLGYSLGYGSRALICGTSSAQVEKEILLEKNKESQQPSLPPPYVEKPQNLEAV